MSGQKEPVLGIILGDHAGSSPELAAKLILNKKDPYIPVLVGNRARFEISRKAVDGAEKIEIIPWTAKNRPESCKSMAVYFYNVDAGPDIEFGKVTEDSGKLQYESMKTAIDLEKEGKLDGILMAPITKSGLHVAGNSFSSEFEVFGYLYHTGRDAASVLKCGNYFRATVVGHCPFKDIAKQITKESIIATSHRLLKHMRYFCTPEECTIAIAALNPHAGENGLFGDEEMTIIKPAIESLTAEGYNVQGPWPADTALNKILQGAAKGIVYLYHDQGNIAMKANSFGQIVLIYVDIPGLIVSVGHGPAYGKAGKGTADPTNMIEAVGVLYQIAKQRMK
ncbi:MAG: 4-hydroxythreonine-4-phosphate dehydrogenase PdxA [Sphaerochaetaceae bacterium]|jgi:4-hydroxythreonine-4-phosphate dehydrogenase|nr:4-hydroxythreonine-4-phosphate dehydrogenase PdxA [Sphaerochaetaceae bacterium]